MHHSCPGERKDRFISCLSHSIHPLSLSLSLSLSLTLMGTPLAIHRNIQQDNGDSHTACRKKASAISSSLQSNPCPCHLSFTISHPYLMTEGQACLFSDFTTVSFSPSLRMHASSLFRSLVIKLSFLKINE